VVHDEVAGGTEALRAQPCAVAVAGQDQQPRVLDRRDDLSLDPAGASGAGAGSAEAFGGGPQELVGRGRGQPFQLEAGVACSAAGRGEEGVDDLWLASWRAVAGVRPTMGAMSAKDRSNMSCRTKASRSAGVSVSSTTCSASPTESASSASSSGLVPSVR